MVEIGRYALLFVFNSVWLESLNPKLTQEWCTKRTWIRMTAVKRRYFVRLQSQHIRETDGMSWRTHKLFPAFLEYPSVKGCRTKWTYISEPPSNLFFAGFSLPKTIISTYLKVRFFLTVAMIFLQMVVTSPPSPSLEPGVRPSGTSGSLHPLLASWTSRWQWKDPPGN